MIDRIKDEKTAYDFSYTSIKGDAVKLAEYTDYVLLIVNTASKCGFTPQFNGLEKLYNQYKSRKFAVIGFPCNQFQNQDPGSNKEIYDFCNHNYNVSFPMAAKIDVNGPATHPLFIFLKSNSKGFLGSERIKWNFTKFLIDRNGHIYKRFAPYIKPSQISSYIDKLT